MANHLKNNTEQYFPQIIQKTTFLNDLQNNSHRILAKKKPDHQSLGEIKTIYFDNLW